MRDILPGQNRLLTLGQIALRCQVPIHRVKYAIDAYRIAPLTRVGIVRVWLEDDLPRIKGALSRVADRRGGRQ